MKTEVGGGEGGERAALNKMISVGFLIRHFSLARTVGKKAVGGIGNYGLEVAKSLVVFLELSVSTWMELSELKEKGAPRVL